MLTLGKNHTRDYFGEYWDHYYLQQLLIEISYLLNIKKDLFEKQNQMKSK